MATVLLGSGSVYALYSVIAGPKADGTGVTSGGWNLTPAGKQLTLGSFPMGGALSPDQRYLVAANAGAGVQSLQVVDVAQQKVVQTLPYNSPEALYLGVAFSPDGKQLYASAGGNNKVRIFSFTNGQLTELAPIQMKDPKDANAQFYPAGISVSPDGKALYVANNLQNSVSRVDLATGQIAVTTPVGQRPYTAVVSRDGNTVYVSNWGESSVTVLDAKDLSVKKTIPVGLHPNAVAENPATGTIYVANSDSDQISVVDPLKQSVLQTISLAPYHGAPTGSQPDALTLSNDGKTLYVANALNNDIAVIDVGNGGAKVKGLIPTAWYPTGVFAGNDGKQLMVLNAKGLGAGPNGVNQGWSGNMIQGSASLLAVPDAKQLTAYTKQVEANNHVTQAQSAAWFKPQQTQQAFPIPRHDDKSPIKHVIYVIKENQTYDHIFGDLGKGNGDPSLALYGKDVTPNQHKLANQFVTFDNFYADGEVSADGHNWTTAAKANDYTQKNWLADYSGRNRDYDFEGGGGGNQPSGAPFSRSSAGYIWDVAMKAGLTFRNYGEFMHNYDPKTKQYYPSDVKTNDFGGQYDPLYPGWDLTISDSTRYQEWEREFKQFQQNGKLPQLETVYLPNDHTGGGKWGPQQMVAQNDMALGKLVDTVSHSQYWKDTVILVVEDDSQGGLDHVDAHRTVALAISPYTQKGTVDSTFYDTPSMLRTMELILGLKPMTQFEAAAIPMVNAFTSQPKFTPYQAEQSKFWTDGAGAPTAGSPAVPSPASVSGMDFSAPDTVDRAALNQENWKAIKGYYPATPAKKN
ncbi:MAG: beta-propeller repeat protein [Firmicutes bacterium]|nr:beta-propeller repeat protein [Bacillota bacterium]